MPELNMKKLAYIPLSCIHRYDIFYSRGMEKPDVMVKTMHYLNR